MPPQIAISLFHLLSSAIIFISFLFPLHIIVFLKLPLKAQFQLMTIARNAATSVWTLSVQRLSWVACALNFEEIILSRCSSCCALFSLSYGCSFCFNFCSCIFFYDFSFCVDFYDPVFTSVFNRNRAAAAAARTM